MYIVHVSIKVKNECIEEFKKATIENAKNSINEAGIARFDVLQEQEDPSRFLLEEVYYTTEDQLKHRETEHYKKWRAAIDDLLAQPYTFVKYHGVEKIEKDEFDSEFSNVKYLSEDNIVFLTWKKFCCYDDYRKPATFALELLKKYPNSNFVVDARNGFEDVKEDAEWGFTVLIPAMSNTACKNIVFIMNEVSEIEEEMDMWTKEFMKYFTVNRVKCYEDAVKLISNK